MKRFFSIAGQFALWFLFWFFVKFWYLAALSVILMLAGFIWQPFLWAGIILASVTALFAVIRTFIKLAELGLFAAAAAGAGAVASGMNAYNDKVNSDNKAKTRSL